MQDSRAKKMLSVLALVAGLVACISVICLTVLDTYRYHEKHGILLLCTFGGIAISALCTTAVYLDQTVEPSPFKRLRL